MASQEATLIAAWIAAAASLLSLLLNSRLTYNRERRQALVRKEIDRMFAIEELAGELAELAGSYRRVWSGVDEARLAQLLRDMESTAGRMARYPEIRQTLRDLDNICHRLLAATKGHEADEREVRAELEPALTRLHRAVDRQLGRRALAT